MCCSANTVLPCTPAAVPAARRWLTEQLTSFYDDLADTADDALLVVSELVTNCVRADPHQLSVGLEAHQHHLTVRATDDAPGWPSPRTATADATNGRGLSIVNALTTSWGIRHDDPDGKTVWARLPVPVTSTPRFGCDR